MLGQTNKKVLKNKLQRKLRRNMTDAERLLWRVLRNKQMAGFKFRRQHPFGDFILDFVCFEKMLVIEIDGGQHAEHQASDNMRTEKLANAGFNVLRFWNHEVLGQIEIVKERIWLELQKTGAPHPHLNPLPEGEETIFLPALQGECRDGGKKGISLPAGKPERAEKTDIISNQKGASIIAVIAIMLILAVMGAALVSLVTTGSDISINQLQSEQAFSIAEGGIEKALTEFVKNNTPCASLVYTNSLGAGSFTTTPTLHTVSFALFANITAADTVIPVASTLGYASHGRIRIENEDINYAATSTTCAPFASPACFTGAQRGVAGSTAVLHNAGAGINTAQEECLVRSTGTVTNSSARRVVEKGLQMPGAMMVYAKELPLFPIPDPDRDVPFFRRWDGTNWGPEQRALSVGGDQRINYMVLKFARTRNEAILGTLQENGDIEVQVWNGNTQTWIGPTPLANVGGSAIYRGFDIEYETFGDRAIVVYNDGTGDPDYRIWNGTAWSAATNIVIPTGGDPVWIELAPYPLLNSSPRNNEIAMIVLTDSGTPDVFGMRWDGATWDDMVPGVGGTWDGTAANNCPGAVDPCKVIDVAYEQLTGRAIFIWGDNANGIQRYRIWDGAALAAPVNLDLTAIPGPDMNGEANWVRLAARPNSDELMYGVQDENLDLFTARWTGGPPWVSPIRHDASTETDQNSNFDIVFETNPAFAGQAWLVWGNGGTTSRRQWTGAAWGGITNFGDDAALVQLMAHPRTGVIFTGIYQATGSGTDDITALQNVGGIWSAETQIWNGGITSNLYERVFIATERYVPIINWREIYP